MKTKAIVAALLLALAAVLFILAAALPGERESLKCTAAAAFAAGFAALEWPS